MSNQQQPKNVEVDFMQDFVRDVIKETAAVVQNATKFENSGLIQKMDDTLKKVVNNLDVVTVQQKIYIDEVKEVKRKFDEHTNLLNQFAITLNECTNNNKSMAVCVNDLQESIKATKVQVKTAEEQTEKVNKKVAALYLTARVSGYIVFMVAATLVGLVVVIYNKDIDRLQEQYDELKSSMELPLDMASL